MTDSDLGIQACVPDVPDVQSIIDKNIASARGKVADIDFRPVDFDLNISKFFTFDVFGKILGKPKGLGYDMCEICDSDGGGIDAAIGGSPFPNGAQDTIDGINSSIDGLQGQIDNIPIPEDSGQYFSLDSAIGWLYQQVDSVSDVVDSAGI